MIGLGERSVFTMDRYEQSVLLAGAAAAAGEIIGERQADCAIDLCMTDGVLDSSQKRLIVHGIGIGKPTNSLLLEADDEGGVSCEHTSVNYVENRPHLTHTWLHQGDDGGIQKISARTIERGMPEMLSSEPATAETVQQLLQMVRSNAARLPLDRPDWRLRGQAWDNDMLAIDTNRLMPAVADVLQIVGGALTKGASDQQSIYARLNVDVNGVGRIYGDPANLRGDQELSISVVDGPTRSSRDFSLRFKYGGRADGQEFSFVRCWLRREERTAAHRQVIKDILGQQQEETWVTQKRKVDMGQVEILEGQAAPSNVIVAMAEEVVELAALRQT